MLSTRLLLDIQSVNKIQGIISNIEISGSMSIVSIRMSEDIVFKSIIIETPNSANYLREGNAVHVLFKETEVILGSDENHMLSLQNQISGTVQSISRSDLLTKVILATSIGQVTSIISTEALEQLGIDINIKLKAMIKLNEIMLAP